jgi:PAS domain S-box-containing protein
VTIETPQPDPAAADKLLSGGGEMGALIAAFDWSRTPLGPISDWPQSLITAVRIILTSRYAMFIWWGRDLINLYNDPYRAFLGIKHPGALGQSASSVWSEIWEQIGPRTDSVLLRGESTYDEALLLMMDRHGYLEETYFTFAYSPLPDDKGGVAGLFCAVTEDTQRVVGERRLKLLRETASAVAESRTPSHVCEAVAECLASARDLPFSLIYLIEPDGKSLKRIAQAGIASDHAAAPERMSLGDDEASIWPLRRVIERGEAVLVEHLEERIADLPTGEWSHVPECAILMPIAQPGQTRPAGVLIAALNPHRKFGEEFKGFVSLLADQIAAGIGNAVAYETERQRAESLAELDRAKTAFFSNVSHEFRTPLTLLLGPLDEVLGKSSDRLPGEDREQLVVARKNALRLLQLVNSLLDFSRIEAGREQAIYEATDLCTLTEDIASVFRSAMEKAGLRFSVECEPLAEPVYVDREMWEKIVLNLLSNAFKFTFEGEVAVRLKAVGDAVELTVCDTGVGIPEDERPRVFERFHRIENSRARTYEGTGIGLALVQELVKLHGGSVRLESKAGRGSTFTVSIPKTRRQLPASQIPAEPNSAEAALRRKAYAEEALRLLPQGSPAQESTAVPTSSSTPAPMGAKATPQEVIVLADDNADMREYVGHLLGERYKVHAVRDGIEALEAIRRLRPALVLSDVMMPRLDGFGLLRALRDDPATNTVPVILLSARAGEDSRVEGLQAGADDYLVKPFTALELLARVETHIRMAKANREAARREAALRAETELERHRLQELLAQVPAAIGVLNGSEHRWTYVNDFYVGATGRERAQDFLGKTFRESLPELEGQGFLELLDEVYRTGKPFSGREVMAKLNRAADGHLQESYFNFVYQPIRNIAGNVTGILVHGVDVTDQVAARKAIEISEERLRLAQAAAQIGTWDWDGQRNITRLSAEVHQIFGTDPDDPHYAEVWAARVHRDDLPYLQEQMQAGLKSGSMEFEYRYHHPVNGLRWFYGKGRRLDGERLLGILQDVTERKRAEETQQRLAAIIESSDDAIVGKDLHGIVTSWNLGAEKMFGYTAHEMEGQPITKIIPIELHADETRILETIGRGERIDHFETTRMRKNGERIEVSLTVSPINDESGKIIGAAKIARDITHRKQAEQALRTSERLASVGRLAATVAHEINNPLEAVTNLIFLAKNKTDDADVREYLSGAEEELERVSHLTKQTLGFYRDTRGATATKVGAMVAPLLSVFGSRTRNKSIEIVSDIRHDPEIKAVPGEIRQLLANLLSNSIDAVEDGGKIRIRVSAASDWNADRRAGVRLTVADSGSGIPAAIRSKLFEPFFTTKKDVGTGLGLWVCKSIIEKQGGNIRVKSSVLPGKSGTTFSVFLPAEPQSSVPDKDEF